MRPNKALHLTAIPLRSIAAGELGRYEVAPIFLMGQVFGSALKRQGSSEKVSVWPSHQAQQFFCLGQVA